MGLLTQAPVFIIQLTHIMVVTGLYREGVIISERLILGEFIMQPRKHDSSGVMFTQI